MRIKNGNCAKCGKDGISHITAKKREVEMAKELIREAGTSSHPGVLTSLILMKR